MINKVIKSNKENTPQLEGTLQNQMERNLPCLFGNLLCCYKLCYFVNTRMLCGFVKAKGFIILFWEWYFTWPFPVTLPWCSSQSVIYMQTANMNTSLEFEDFCFMIRYQWIVYSCHTLVPHTFTMRQHNLDRGNLLRIFCVYSCTPRSTLRKKWRQNSSTPWAVSWDITHLHLWHYGSW